MRSVLGMFLCGLGVAMAALWLPPYDGERQLAVVTEIATQGIARVAVPEQPVEAGRSGRTFSPQTPLIVDQRGKADAAPTTGTDRRSNVAGASATGGPMVRNVPSAPVVTNSVVVSSGPSGGDWPGVKGQLTYESASTAVTPSVGQGRPATVRPGDEASRGELVRNLQRELKRVGCYTGDVDGDWGSGSKRAMGAFTDRVNAKLPIDEPDYILLTLLQGYMSQACGKGCPAGQSTQDGGRCVPNAVVAQSSRRSADKPASRDQEPARTAAVQPEPRATDTSTRVADSTWAASVQPAAPSVTPSIAAATVAAASVATAGVAVAAATLPLPGRMSIGATRTDTHADALSGGAAPPTVAGPAIRKIMPAPADADQDKLAEDHDAKAKVRERSKPRQATQGSASSAPPRPAPRAVVVYREQPRYRPPAVFFAPPQPRQTSRSWTAGFFERR